MGFSFPLMLLGLAGVAIPIIIHLLNRRRFDVVDWGAMQFLQISETTRRRLLLEELLLMMLRIGLLEVLLLAFSGLFFDTTLPLRLGGRNNRDAVLIIDGSASMLAHAEGDKPPADRGRRFEIPAASVGGQRGGRPAGPPAQLGAGAVAEQPAGRARGPRRHLQGRHRPAWAEKLQPAAPPLARGGRQTRPHPARAGR